MEIQKEIELFEEILLANPDLDKSLLLKDEDGNYEDSSIADQLGFFQAGIEVAEREARMGAKVSVPEGFVLVPKKPTEELLSKAIRKYLEVSDLSIITSRMAHLYELMIKEAQEPSDV